MITSADTGGGISSIQQLEQFAVMEVEKKLGKVVPPHYMDAYDQELANIGEELIKKGKSSFNGKSGKLISAYFNCTDCHNLVRESEDLTNLDPQDRLDYLTNRNLPFTAGSTFFGIYNRTSFYNDDYYKKYGDLVNDAKDSLANSIQLCAEYCASGRPLEQWELDAILHYYKREELKIAELGLSSKELRIVSDALDKNDDQQKALEILNSHYVKKYGATFTGAMPEHKRKYGEGGDVINGEKLYKSACMYCHENVRVTYLDLDDDVLSGKYLWNHKEGYDDLSVYQVIRWGTYPIAGRQQYMPLYPKEKMSDKQLEDLMAYIKKLANK